jgi:hypothetical protein
MAMRLSWALLLIAASAALGACNAAISDHPMFPESERSSRLVLEDGLWLLVEPDCDVDTAKPTETWPKCADWVVINHNVALKSSDNKPNEEPEDVFIVEGKPPLIQAKTKMNGSDLVYAFLALEAQASSSTGRITDAKVWMVPCGVEEPTEDATPKVKPYPGFTEDCMPQTVAALRTAAAKGPSKDTDVAEWKWVRAATP